MDRKVYNELLEAAYSFHVWAWYPESDVEQQERSRRLATAMHAAHNDLEKPDGSEK